MHTYFFYIFIEPEPGSCVPFNVNPCQSTDFEDLSLQLCADSHHLIVFSLNENT